MWRHYAAPRYYVIYFINGDRGYGSALTHLFLQSSGDDCCLLVDAWLTVRRLLSNLLTVNFLHLFITAIIVISFIAGSCFEWWKELSSVSSPYNSTHSCLRVISMMNLCCILREMRETQQTSVWRVGWGGCLCTSIPLRVLFQPNYHDKPLWLANTLPLRVILQTQTEHKGFPHEHELK